LNTGRFLSHKREHFPFDKLGRLYSLPQHARKIYAISSSVLIERLEITINFPTSEHQQTAETIASFFAAYPQIDTVLLVNSCARGQATPESDLDFAILVEQDVSQVEIQIIERQWLDFSASQPDIVSFKHRGPFSQVHLDLIRGEYTAQVWDDGGGPDFFEIEIGNQVAHSAPMGTSGPRFEQLQATWLPFYNEQLHLERLPMVRAACIHDLDHVPHYVKRELYFQAFDRFYRAYQEFLQALFIARKTYPIAYNKWIREQIENWLGLPDLYTELPRLLSIQKLDSTELIDKATHLRALLDQWTGVG
jgi:predicted nucleotidyltransferase